MNTLVMDTRPGTTYSTGSLYTGVSTGTTPTIFTVLVLWKIPEVVHQKDQVSLELLCHS